MRRGALFLDRDGTLIKDTDYLSQPEDIEWLPDVFDVLQFFQEKDYALIVITNQSGIGRGFFSEKDYEAVHQEFCTQASQHNINFTATYYCPHNPESETCHCRKPLTGLFEKALTDHLIDPSKSLAVGDRERDLIPARQVGISETFLVTRNQGLGRLKDYFNE